MFGVQTTGGNKTGQPGEFFCAFVLAWAIVWWRGKNIRESLCGVEGKIFYHTGVGGRCVQHLDSAEAENILWGTNTAGGG